MGLLGSKRCWLCSSIVRLPLNQRANGETEGWQVTRHGFPDLLQIHTQIIMNKNVPHAGDGLPRGGRFGLAKVGRQILHGLADHDQIAYHSILQKRGSKKSCAAFHGVESDALKGFANVGELRRSLLTTPLLAR